MHPFIKNNNLPQKIIKSFNIHALHRLSFFSLVFVQQTFAIIFPIRTPVEQKQKPFIDKVSPKQQEKDHEDATRALTARQTQTP